MASVASAPAQAACPDTSPADGKCDSPAPNSLFGNANGKNYHDAQQTVWTQDVGNNVTDIVEYSRLIDGNGITACDKYWGWRGQTANQSLEQEVLCGKYMFFYEHYTTPGVPNNLGKMNKLLQRHELQVPPCIDGDRDGACAGIWPNDIAPWEQINDGEKFTFNDGVNPPITFEFDKSSNHSGFGNTAPTVEVMIAFNSNQWRRDWADEHLIEIQKSMNSCDGVDNDTDCSWSIFTFWCNGFDDTCDARNLNLEAQGLSTHFTSNDWKDDGYDQERLIIKRKAGKEGAIAMSSETVADADFVFRKPWLGDELDALGYDPNPLPRRDVRDVVKYNGTWYETGVSCHPNRKTASGECLQWCTKDALSDLLLGQGCLQEAADSNATPLNPAAHPPPIYADQSAEDPGYPIGMPSSPKWDYEMRGSAYACAACHMGQLPDGRYAVGLEKQNQNYGQVIHSLSGPMMVAMEPLMGLMGPLMGLLPSCGGASDSFCDSDTENCSQSAAVYAVDELDADQSNQGCFTDLLGEDLGNTVSGLMGMLTKMGVHPDVQFNNKASTFAYVGSAYENMAKDYSKGTCYYTAEGQILSCAVEHTDRGSQWKKDRATHREQQLQRLWVDSGVTSAIVKRDWYMAGQIMGDDIYALKGLKKPSQLIPAGNDNLSFCNWDFNWYEPQRTFDSVRASCHGLRWDTDYWKDFLGGMMGMMGSMFGEQGLPLLPMTMQDAFARFDVGNLDFVSQPLMEDGINLNPEDYDNNGDGIADCIDNDGDPNTIPVACANGAPILDAIEQTVTLSRYPSLFNIASDQKAIDYGMVGGGGQAMSSLAFSGAADSALTFASSFPIISNGVDPRYVECDEDLDGDFYDNDSSVDVDGDGTNDQLEGRLDAKPWHIQGRCRPIRAAFQPLATYLGGLKAPNPASGVSIHDAGTGNATEGRAVFDQHCLSCHNGPSGETNRIFMFSELADEGTATVPYCSTGQASVEWDETSLPRTPIYNDCQPHYMDPTVNQAKHDKAPLVGGFIGVDPQYSRIFSPDPTTGDPVRNPNSSLNNLGVITQGVRGTRLGGLRYRYNMLHHGRIKGTEELLCMPGTARATAACSGGETFGCNYGRDYNECLFYDLDGATEKAAYQNGTGQCMQNFAPFRGHEFGCDLTTADKEDLIAYLNSL